MNQRTTIFLCLAAIGWSATVWSAEISVSVPDDPNIPPQVNADRVEVDAGGELGFDVNAGKRAIVIFPGATPILKNGKEVFEIKLKHQDKKKFTVKDYCDSDLADPCEYKYDVVDSKDRNRPVLDPIIVIRR